MMMVDGNVRSARRGSCHSASGQRSRLVVQIPVHKGRVPPRGSGAHVITAPERCKRLDSDRPSVHNHEKLALSEPCAAPTT